MHAQLFKQGRRYVWACGKITGCLSSWCLLLIHLLLPKLFLLLLVCLLSQSFLLLLLLLMIHLLLSQLFLLLILLLLICLLLISIHLRLLIDDGRDNYRQQFLHNVPETAFGGGG